MNYSYVLLSEQDGRFSIGSTGHLRARLQQVGRALVEPGETKAGPAVAATCSRGVLLDLKCTTGAGGDSMP